MADTKISAMAAAATLSGSELVAGVQSGGNVKITAQDISDFITSGDGGSFDVIDFGSGNIQLTERTGDTQRLVTVTAEPTGDAVGLEFVMDSVYYGNFAGNATTSSFNFYSPLAIQFVTGININLDGPQVSFQAIPIIDPNGILDQSGNVFLDLVAGQQAAIAAPSGGATVDTQARTAINSIRAALTATGLTL